MTWTDQADHDQSAADHAAMLDEQIEHDLGTCTCETCDEDRHETRHGGPRFADD